MVSWNKPMRRLLSPIRHVDVALHHLHAIQQPLNDIFPNYTRRQLIVNTFCIHARDQIHSDEITTRKIQTEKHQTA